MDKELPLSKYITQSQNIKPDTYNKKIKIGILSSFTINGLAEVLKQKCAEKKIGCFTYVGPYNQYNQEILNEKSNLYSFSPDITFLILDVQNIFGELFYNPYSISDLERENYVEEKVNELVNLINRFTLSSSKLVITNLVSPSYSPYGIAEMKTKYSFDDAITDFNKKIKEKLFNLDNVYLLDFNKFVKKFGEKNIFNFQNYFFGDIKISLDLIPYLGNELISYVIAILGLTKKCIVLDLDNTIWGGVIGEDGFDGIRLGPQPPGNTFFEFQKHLKALSERGIILAINSKNNFNDAIKVICEHPYMVLREDDFACIRINWEDKVTNMYEISKELNIGLDSFVFLDDDPVNRELIKKFIPQILVPEFPTNTAELVPLLQSLNEFSILKITNEDAKRGEMYVQQKKREELKEKIPDLNEFLKTLDLQVTVKQSDSFTIPRISQLTLKTNQFNLTTRRYSENDINKFAHDKNMLVGCASIKDKFGDNGITGVFIIEKLNFEEWFIESFLLSCRVMGREVEKAILNYIINEARKNNVKRLLAKYVPTDKNKPIEGFLEDNGFIKKDEYWIFDLQKPFNMPKFLTLSVG